MLSIYLREGVGGGGAQNTRNTFECNKVQYNINTNYPLKYDKYQKLNIIGIIIVDLWHSIRTLVSRQEQLMS